MIVELLDGELVIDETLVEEPESEIRKQAKEFLNGDREVFDLESEYPDEGLDSCFGRFPRYHTARPERTESWQRNSRVPRSESAAIAQTIRFR